MFVGIKSIYLRMLRTLPKLWVTYFNGTSHCWIPKSGFAYKLKNMVPPPNETDLEARRDWHFCECEILFGKEFQRYNDCEMALSKLSYDQEWYYCPTSSDRLPTRTELTEPPPVDIELNESSALDFKINNLIEPREVDNELAKSSTEPATSNPTGSSEVVNTSCDPIVKIRKLAESSTESATSNPTGNSEAVNTSWDPIVQIRKLTESSTEPTVDPELKRYLENVKLCEIHFLKPPIHYKKFKKLEYTYVRTFNLNDLEPGCKFLTIEELSAMERRIDMPFCRPGPLETNELYEWYMVDSIVQAVQVKNSLEPSYVVRWLGYEDEYNTVEPLVMVKHTAVHKKFTNPELYLACGSNQAVLRRSKRIDIQKGIALEKEVTRVQMDMARSTYDQIVSRLLNELRSEEIAGRYSPEIGFCSNQSVIEAQTAQHNFFIDKFIKIVNNLQSPVYMDRRYVGEMFGNLGQVREFKAMSKSMCVKNLGSLKSYIYSGLKTNSNILPRYVAFFVPHKFNTNECKGKVHMSFHMCAFVIRDDGRCKDAIYYDPSSKAFSRQMPDILNNLTDPKFTTFTNKFGTVSQKDDCVFKCMQYIIGIATGHILFEPDLAEPSRKIGKFLYNRAAKKMKVDIN